MNPRKEIVTGAEYGWLTVLREVEKDESSHRRFEVECRCGKRYIVFTGFLGKPEPKCWECSHIYDMAKRRMQIENTTINSWSVLRCIGKSKNRYMYECRCLKCGHISTISGGNIRNSKNGGCQYCTPEYHFKIDGECATGVLPNGQEFLVDADMVAAVSNKHWNKRQRYIVSVDGGEKIFLHRFVLGYSNADSVLIDHKNRDTSDCRRSNLRLVTTQQNNMNKSLQKNNTSGYVGVTFDKRDGMYCAKIGLNNKDIYIGRSADAIECAQMRNYATKLLFRQFAGHENDVPSISERLRRRVEEKLAPYMNEAFIATRTVKLKEYRDFSNVASAKKSSIGGAHADRKDVRRQIESCRI